MTKEMKQEFTLRITQANKSETIVILCDMLLEYIKDAKKALENKENPDVTAFREAIRRARGCLSELIASLHMEYEIAGNIYALYRFVERELIKADIRREEGPLSEAEKIISRLNESYREVSKRDTSPAIMSNTETVYAGMTYGKNNITESSSVTSNRGFFA